jgi:hypothetical protein
MKSGMGNRPVGGEAGGIARLRADLTPRMSKDFRRTVGPPPLSEPFYL